MKRYNKIMEKFWLVVAILTFGYAVYRIAQDGISEAGIYLIMPVAAATLSYLRYYVRKRIERAEEQNQK